MIMKTKKIERTKFEELSLDKRTISKLQKERLVSGTGSGFSCPTMLCTM